MVRALFGFFKQFSYKTPKFEVFYFFVMVFISSIIGLLTAVATKELELNFFGLGEFTPALTFIVGYAEGDFLENVYKTIIKKPSLYSFPKDLIKK